MSTGCCFVFLSTCDKVGFKFPECWLGLQAYAIMTKCLFPVIQAFAKLCDRPFVSYKLLRAQKRFANFIVLVLIPLLVSSHPDTWAGLLPRLRTAQASYRSPGANTNRTPFQKTSIISSKDHPGNRCQRADICSKTAVAPQHLVSSMHALSFQPV